MTTTRPKTLPQAGKLCTGADIKTAKPGVLRFGNGLYLHVSPKGTKSWRVNYHVNGRHQITTLGRWPDVSVSDAKAKRAAIREDVRTGGDPSVALKLKREERRAATATTVRAMAEAWIVAKSAKWSPNYRRDVPLRLRLHVYPVIGDLPVASVTKDTVKALLIRLADKSIAMSAHIQGHLTGVFDYAVDHDKVANNPLLQLRRWLPKRGMEDKRAHVSTIEDARRVLKLIEAEDTRPSLILGHRFLALTGVRKTEALGACWSEFNADLSAWTIPAVRMKAKQQHVVPLAPQAIEVVRVARALQAATGEISEFVFPASWMRSAPTLGCITGSALNKVMVRALTRGGMAGRHTPHGWRYTFSTAMNESDHTLQQLVEVALAHTTKTWIGRIYDESQHLGPRRVIACAWADRLLEGAPSPWSLVGLQRPKQSADIIELREAA